MRLFVYLFWLCLIVLGITFASLNPQQVHVNFYFMAGTWYLSFLLASSLVVGIAVGFLLFLKIWVGSRVTNRRLRKKLRKLEKELRNLRPKDAEASLLSSAINSDSKSISI